MTINKLSIIIPAYNEGNTIHHILDKLKKVELINNIKKNCRCQQVNEEILGVFCIIGLHCLHQLPIESAASESHSYPGYQFPQGSDPLQYCHFYRQVWL